MTLDNDLQAPNKKLVRVLSQERLKGYLTPLAQQHHCSTTTLYHWNIMLSENLYPALNVIEVIFRNALHVSIGEHFENFDWFDLAPFPRTSYLINLVLQVRSNYGSQVKTVRQRV